jgi:hypothetical protein
VAWFVTAVHSYSISIGSPSSFDHDTLTSHCSFSIEEKEGG